MPKSSTRASPKPALPEEVLAPLLRDRELLAADNRRRRDPNIYANVQRIDEAKFLADGWIVHGETTKNLKLKRPKPHDVSLEDRVWALCYKMGYPILSGNRFSITFHRDDRSLGKKQIDVFAKDDETCLVVECKSRDRRGRRDLQKDIHETIALQKPFANSIRHQFQDGAKLKLIWIYVTNNIIWSEPDLQRAQSSSIRIITENDLQYFETFISHMGTAGRYQFLAEFLAGTPIPGLEINVPAVKGQFGPNKFYSFAISPKHLLKIAFVNHQALNHPGSRPAYQRMINRNRIKVIGEFIKQGGFFPTNILLNFTHESRFEQLVRQDDDQGALKFGWLYLPNTYKSAWIIDGQHRLYGFSNLEDKYLENSTLFVLAFEKLDARTEAELFITINHEQKSVPKSLLVSLQADLKLGSDDPKEALGALSSAIVRTLSNHPTSPFYGRLQVPGLTPQPSQNLTIAEVVKGISQSGSVGRIVGRKQNLPGFLSQGTDRKTIERARRVLNGYFKIIMDSNPARWAAGRAEWICVNPGIRAHLLLISEILKHLDAKGIIDAHMATEDELVKQLTNFIAPIISFVKSATVGELEAKFSRKFGEGGVLEYHYNLCELLLQKHKDFGSAEFKAYVARQKDARAGKTRQDVLDLVQTIMDVTVSVLKSLYGTSELESGEKAYWDLGIDNSQIKAEAYKKQQMAPKGKRLPKEAYLDLVDCEKIFRQQGNWEQCAAVFNIPMQGVNPKSKTYHLDWIERLNDVRRTAAHGSAIRGFSHEDIEFVNWLKRELYQRLDATGRLPETA